MAISTEERSFFVAMGERIAALRKAHSVTQVQLAEALGVSQQTLQSYEVGRRRIRPGVGAAGGGTHAGGVAR